MYDSRRSDRPFSPVLASERLFCPIEPLEGTSTGSFPKLAAQVAHSYVMLSNRVGRVYRTCADRLQLFADRARVLEHADDGGIASAAQRPQKSRRSLLRRDIGISGVFPLFSYAVSPRILRPADRRGALCTRRGRDRGAPVLA